MSTINDRPFTKAMLRIERKRKRAEADMRAGDLASAREHLNQLSSWLDVAKERIAYIAKITREPMGS